MNAATKVITHGTVIVREPLPLVVRLPESRLFVFLFIILLSGLALIYVKDLNRRLFMDYQHTVAQTEQLQTDNNKLLLEQSAWSSQARVQEVAEQQLNMQMPATKDIVMLKV